MIHMYHVQEIFNSIQGEGVDTGRPVCFVRFYGCNLKCPFCDTRQKPSEWRQFDTSSLVNKVIEITKTSLIILTGGEPAMRNLQPLVTKLKREGYYVGIETNGLFTLPRGLCSVSLSPKTPRAKLKIQYCDSLKILYPYMRGITADSFASFPARYRSLQPIDHFCPEENEVVINRTIKEVTRLGDSWRLGVQLHKLIGLK